MIIMALVKYPLQSFQRNEGDSETGLISTWLQWDATEVTAEEVLKAAVSKLSDDALYYCEPQECTLEKYKVVTWDDDWDDLQLYWGSTMSNWGARDLFRAWRDGELHVVDRLECFG